MLHLLDCFAYTNRWKTRHPAEKVAFAGGLLALSLFMPLEGALMVLFVVAAATLLGAQVPPRIFLKALAVPVVFIAVGSLSMLISVTIDGGFRIGLALDQAPRAALLATRAMAAASCLCFLGLTTPAPDWLPLLRRLRVPAIIVDVMFVVYRFLFLFVERFSAMRTAHDARLGYASARNTLRSSGLIGANLLVFALKRARRTEMGLASRGCFSELPMLPFEKKPSRRVMAGIALVLLATAAFGFSVGRLWNG